MSGNGMWSQLLQAWKDRPRRRRLVVTDVTRMEGDRVCVAGYLEDGRMVRPVGARGGPTTAWLRPGRGGMIEPFTLVDLRVLGAPKLLTPPHTEDRLVPVRGHRRVGELSEWERLAWLESSLAPTVRDIFGATVHADSDGRWGRFVRAGEGARSLGTIKPSRILAVRYAHYPERGRWDYRLRFRDGTGEEFQLAVTDLAFRDRLDDLRDSGRLPDRVAAETCDALQQQTVYLRIGLARGWDRHPDRCYLQITGVYGFPPSSS
jgi:hypothetical protein